MLYRLEQRIYTLAKNFVGLETSLPPQFSVEGVSFTRWLHSETETWTNKYWIATAEIDALNFRQAWRVLWAKLSKSVPRICTVSQCYTEHLGQPLLIFRPDIGVAFVRWTQERGATGLMFGTKELTALNALMQDSRIPNEFFWYWNDATNATGYASKLMLMLSAVETLVNVPIPSSGKPRKDYAKLEAILGPELKKEFWGEADKDNTDAIRHSLTHGRYFPPSAGQKDFLLILHQRVIAYLNNVILNEKLINENVVSPQRHPTENKDESMFYIRARRDEPLTLVNVANDLQENFINPQRYEFVSSEKIGDDF